MKKEYLLFGIITIAVLFGILGFAYWEDKTPGALDKFAACLTDKGATFYGAFWCPHCQNQKRMFGRSATLLPYVECSTQNGREQLQVCVDKKIEGYPTWEFSDGSREGGEVSLAKLSEKTGCLLPQ